jgi:hypothetical protein
LQVKGERYPRMFTVEMKADSINQGDVFILDMNDKIFLWAGDECNVNEKMKGLEVVTNMRKSEKHCQAEIYFPKEDPEVDSEFWSHLGGKPSQINPSTPDDVVDESEEQKYSFYKISNATGKLQCQEIKDRPLTREMLDTNDVFILELYQHVYIWIGKGADVEEKKNALIIGKGFFKAHNKVKGTRVSRIVENGEDVHFKSYFKGFYPILKKEHGSSLGYDMSVTQHQDFEKLANGKRKAVEDLMTKLGNYTVKVYLCVDGQPKELP